MGGVINFAKNVYSGIKNVGYQIWNGIKNVATKVFEIGERVVVGFVNGIKKIIKVASSILINAIKGVLLIFKLILFSVGILLLGLVYLSSLIIFGLLNLQKKIQDPEKEEPQDNNDQNMADNDGNQNNQNQNGEEQDQLYQQNLNNNPNFNNEPKEKKTNLKDDFFEAIESYINEVRNNPDLEPHIKRYIYTFKDDDINERQQASDSDSEINVSEPNVLSSQVKFQVDDGQISLEFTNSIDDIQLGKTILKQIKHQLDVKYNNNVRVLETEDDYREVLIDNIEDIESIKMIIII